MAAQIGAAKAQSDLPDGSTALEWQQLEGPVPQYSASNLPDSVGPLLTTTWDQDQYYNALCPEDPDGPDGHALTGCVATAMAQIINYWGYPVHGRGMQSYSSDYGTLSVNFDSATYNYAHMPTKLSSTSTPQEIAAVSKLMYDCGVAVNMQYGPYESGATMEIIAPALVNHFTMNKKLGGTWLTYFSGEQWLDIIQDNIHHGYPVLYGEGSHLFVIDGVTSDRFYHMNMGWGGDADGWYCIDTTNQSSPAILNIFPDSTSNVILGDAGHGDRKITYEVDSVLHLKHIYGENDFPHYIYTGGGGTTTITFQSKDTSDRLVVDLLSITKLPLVFQFFDGPNDSYPLLREIRSEALAYSEIDIYSDMMAIDMSPVVSNGNSITIAFSDVLSDEGFHFRISKMDECRIVSNIVVNNILDTFLVSWTENGEATEWAIEYGPHGFIPGEGIVLVSDTTLVAIAGLDHDTAYEVRICPICGSDNTDLWRSTSLTQRKYWTDVVWNEPEGYNEDSNDTIYISSPEGLAWLEKKLYMTREFEELDKLRKKNLVLEKDIDLGGLLWRPIKNWSGNVDGRGHVIRNLTVNEQSSLWEGGLFGGFEGCDTVKNLGFYNANIKAYNAGTIAANSPNVTMNCFSLNYHVESTAFHTGGLYGGWSGEMTNCFAEGYLAPAFDGGGIAGNGGGTMSNCYSSLTGLSGVYSWMGLLIAYSRGGMYDNCFADISYVKKTWGSPYVGILYDDPTMGYFFGHTEEIEYLNNIATFTSQNGRPTLINDTALHCGYPENTLLIDALNHYVAERNDPSLRMWVWDSVLCLPVFGDYYQPNIPNVSEISTQVVRKKDEWGLSLSWIENGACEAWQIKCVPSDDRDSLDVLYFSSNSNSDTLFGLTLGSTYKIFVRPICEYDSVIPWGNSVDVFFDKLYWTDVVTSKPEGYLETSDGHVFISTPEGLAWVSVCSNALHGQPSQNYLGKTVVLTDDINLEGYRWRPIGSTDQTFQGNIDGNGHVISNLYINERNRRISQHNASFISTNSDDTIRNLVIEKCLIIGYDGVSALIGYALSGCVIDNCHSNGIVKGVQRVGGLAGYYFGSNKIINSSARGEVYGNRDVGGLCGYASDVHNSFANCRIHPMTKYNYEWIGGIVGASVSLRNSYCASSVTPLLGIGGTTSANFAFELYPDGVYNNLYCLLQDNNLQFFGDESWGDHDISDTSSVRKDGTLLTSIIIGDTEYSNMLDALNAWVYENDVEGRFLHWRADTANENGGFPMLEQLGKCASVKYTIERLSACESYDLDGVTYTEDETFYDTIPTADGCDSVLVAILTVGHTVESQKFQRICPGESYTFGDRVLTETGNYYDTIPNGSTLGCDSIVELWLEAEYPMSWESLRICPGESYTFGDRVLTETGNYYDTIPNGSSLGCDSIVELWLEVNTPMAWLESQRICPGGSYTFGDRVLTETGWYYDTIPNGSSLGCDSIVGLWLNADYPMSWGSQRICPGESYTFGGRVLTETGNYYDTIPNGSTLGCDSIVELWLEAEYPMSWESLRICPGESYTFGDKVLTETNWYYDTIPNGSSLGCDSIVGLWLDVYSPSSWSRSSICEGDEYLWMGHTLTTDGYYEDTLYGATTMGCDSIVSLTLEVNPSYHLYDTLRLSTNKLPYGYQYGAWSEYSDYSMNMNGGTQTVDTRTYPSGMLYDDGGPTGDYSVSSNSVVTFVADSGNVILLKGSYDVEAGWDFLYFYDDSTLNNEVLMLTGEGELSVQSATGYLSVRLYSDEIIPHGGIALQWTTKQAVDTLLAEAGDYAFNAHTTFGCDSIIYLHLDARDATVSLDSITICSSSLPYAFGDTLIAEAGTYSRHYVDGYGFDSIATVVLSVNMSTTGDTTATACDSFEWHGTAYAASGDYTHSSTNEAGCDSTTTLHLTINLSTTGDTTATACDGYEWHGTAYAASGDYTHGSTNAAGCDSTTTLHLTINASTTGDTTATACDDYEWHGTTYAASGNYTHSSTNAAGCDSTTTLHLTINHSTTGDTTATACDGYEWHGTAYAASGNYTHSSTNAAGCDSTTTLHLTINASTTIVIDSTAADSMMWHDTVYTSTGTYTWHGYTTAGCDSIEVLHLTITTTEGIGDVEEPALSLYPNPTSGKVHIDAEGVECVEVYDASGRLLLKVHRCNDIDISTFAAGTYTLRIVHATGTAVRKVVKH